MKFLYVEVYDKHLHPDEWVFINPLQVTHVHRYFVDEDFTCVVLSSVNEDKNAEFLILKEPVSEVVKRLEDCINGK